MSSKNFMSYEDATTVLGAYAEAIKNIVKDVKVDGQSCLDSNRNAIVQITIPTEYEYTVSKVDNLTLKVTTKQNGVVTDETNYTLTGWSDPVNIDGHIQLNYNISGGTWSVKTLVASTDYPAEQTWTWVYNQTPSVPVLTFEEAENHIGLSAAYADLKTNKQDTLTFDDVPTANSDNPVKSGGVKSAIDAAVASAYHHAGTKTCVELVAGLLVAANEGNVYNMTDSGTTTADFIEGAGQPIKAGDNVGIAKISDGVYKFDLLSGFVDTSNFVQKSVTAGLLKNDGTVDTTIQGDVATLKSGFTNLDNEVNGDATTYPYADVITIPDAIPANLADCTVKIEPVQSGSGDPSPTNIRPITGHTEASVDVTGASVVSVSQFSAGTGTTVIKEGNTAIMTCDALDLYRSVDIGHPGNLILSKGTYRISFDIDSVENSCRIGFRNYDYAFKASTIITGTGHYTDVLTISENCYVSVLLSGATPQTNRLVMSNLFVSKVEHTATIALGDTIYGGTVDFDSGVMTVDRKLVDLGDYTWAPSGDNFYTSEITDFAYNMSDVGPIKRCPYFISDKYVSSSTTTNIDLFFNSGYSGYRCFINGDASASGMTGAEFKEYITGTHLCYELATPTTIQLTPQQIQLLKGTNTLTASTGQISVTANGVSGAIGSLQTQANDTDEALAELAADIAEQLPTAPTTDGAYVLTVTVADGTPTYSWESAT